MAFQNIPLKSIEVDITAVTGVEQLPWYNPTDFPVPPGNPYPTPVPKDFRWSVTMAVSTQTQSSYITRAPGLYNGFDINVGQWIANISTGQAWQIISVTAKTATEVTAIVQDVYRYNTFADTSGSGNGGPALSTYIVFTINEEGYQQIDPVPPSGISANFTQNLTSRFNYINLQYDYPLYQAGNSFVVNDVIAADTVNHRWVLADNQHKTVIGRITSISDVLPGWFTFNPVQKVVDTLNWLPGQVADTIYTSNTAPGGLSTDSANGTPLYIKLRDNTQSETISTLAGPTDPGNVFQLNDYDIIIGGSGAANDVITAVNLETANTGVTASSILAPTTVETNFALLSPTYGEVVLWAASSPATATINGTLVTFDITSTTPGYEDYAQAPQMAAAVNRDAPANIVATTTNNGAWVLLTNTAGGAITIVNGTSDINGVPFAGTNSGSGLALNTSASTSSFIKLLAEDARAIDLLDVVGQPLIDYGLVSVENGIKAAGLYIEGGLRQASVTVVNDLLARDALSPMIGDQVYVIDSNDGLGNNVGLWSMWIWDGVAWVATQYEQNVDSSAKTLSLSLDSTTIASNSTIGTISTGTRVSQIVVEVTTAFDGNPTLDIGYTVSDGANTETSTAGLMSNQLIDLNNVGTYTTTSDILFGTDTITGDVVIKTEQNFSGSTTGSLQILVSYV